MIDSDDSMFWPLGDANQSDSVAEALCSAVPSLVTLSGALAAGWITTPAAPDAIVDCLDSCGIYAMRSASTAALAKAEPAFNAQRAILAKATA